MKRLTYILLFGLSSISGFTQDSTKYKNNYNVLRYFSCEDCTEKYFVSTHSGLLHTPYGVRVGLLGKRGVYLGGRYGDGTIYYPEANTTKKTTLFSITTGLIFPVYIKDRFGVHTYVGAGYGQWFDDRWATWSKGGVEIEGGFMVSYKKVFVSFGGSILNAERSYTTGDATLGIGIRF